MIGRLTWSVRLAFIGLAVDFVAGVSSCRMLNQKEIVRFDGIGSIVQILSNGLRV